MKILNNFSFGKLLNNKKFNIAFSIIVAFIFWLIITVEQNPTRQQTFGDVPITINIENTVAKENGMDIVSDLSEQKFSVTVSGPNYVVSSLKTEDFSLYASLAEITQPGEYKLEVFGNKNTAKGSYDFVSISPSTVKVTVDYVDTKQFTVESGLVGVGATEGLIAEAPIVTATQGDMITVSGPRTVMERIAKVIAYAEVEKTLGESSTFEAKVKFLDNGGKEIDASALTVSDTTVKVTVPISKKATVKVNASFINLPSGYKQSNIKYSIDHKEVTVIGPEDVIDNLKSITLSDIDFSSISPDSNKFDVSAVLPDGVRILDNIEYFTVAVDVSNYRMKTIKTITGVKTTGLASGLTVKKTSSILNVKICAPSDVINRIQSKDLYAVIDLSGKSAGEHTVSATIRSDEFSGVWQVGKYDTTVTIY